MLMSLQADAVHAGHLPNVLELVLADLGGIVQEHLIKGDAHQGVLVAVGNGDALAGGIVAQQEAGIQHGVL